MMLPLTSLAQTGINNNTIRVSAGGRALAGVYSVEYERRTGNQGWSVFGNFSSRRSQTNQFAQIPEQWDLGVGAPIHVVDGTNWDVFVAPELAVIFIKDNLTDGTDITTFGPGLKIGTMYALSPMWSLGFEFTNYTQWFNDKVAINQTSANVALGITF